MTTLHKAAQHALEALEYDGLLKKRQAIAALRAALAQQDEPCPNCASLEAQNAELDRKLAELEQAHGIIESEIKVDSHQTLDEAMRLPRAMAQAYESGYKAGAAAEREAIIQAIPGGHIVDPQWVCDMIRARGNT